MCLLEWSEFKCALALVQFFMANAVFFWSSSDCIIQDTTHSIKWLLYNFELAGRRCSSGRQRLRGQQVQAPEINQISSYSELDSNSYFEKQNMLDRLKEQDRLCSVLTAEIMACSDLKKGSWLVCEMFIADRYMREWYTPLHLSSAD